MRRAHLMFALLPFLAASGIEAQQSTFADFEAYRDAMTGRWVADVTWIADWPGLGKRGDKTTGHSENRPSSDGKVLMHTFYGGTGTENSIVIFDAGKRQIREMGSDSGGTSWDCVITRQGEQWGFKCTGSLPDGTPIVNDNVLTLSDGGNTARWRGRNTIGGVETDALQDVWRRVSR